MKEKLFMKFRKSGKILDYLKYREEISKELQTKDVKEKTGNNSKLNRLQRKPYPGKATENQM